jgi:hypothetical protein
MQMALKINNMNKIIWGIAILGGGYLLYNYSKKHFLSTNEMNQYIIHKDKYDFSNMDKKYIQNWADAKRNGLTTFEYNGSNYNVKTGKKVV